MFHQDKTGAQTGPVDSFLNKNKKEMINEFYQLNRAYSKPITDMLWNAELKCGLVFIVTSILTGIARKYGLPVVETVVNICRWGSGVLVGLNTLGSIVIEVLNNVKAKNEYKMIEQMAREIESDAQMMGPNVFASMTISNAFGEIHITNINVPHDIDGVKATFTEYTMSNGEVKYVEVDNWLYRAFSLRDNIFTSKYEGYEYDLSCITRFIEDYLEFKDNFKNVENGIDERQVILNEGLENLENIVAMKLGYVANVEESFSRSRGTTESE